jgi:hypothetical protein
MLKYLVFSPGADLAGLLDMSFRSDPEPQTIRQQDDRTDATEPKRCEPQQALRQRPWILL